MTTGISVIMPAYNAAESIERAVRSILESNAFVKELIVVNDGSSDSTIYKLASLESEFADSLQVIDQPNSGPVLARRAGFANSSGEYLLSVDSDDALVPGAIDLLWRVSQDLKSPDLVMFNGRRVPENVQMCNYNFAREYGRDAAPKRLFLERFIDSAELNNLVLKLFHNRLFDRERDYSFAYGLKHGEDALQVLPLLDKAQTVHVLDEQLYEYKSNPFSITSTGDIGQLRDSKIFRSELLHTATEWGLEDVDRRVNSKFLKSMFRLVQRITRAPESDKDLINSIQDDPVLAICLENHTKTTLSARERYFVNCLERKDFQTVRTYFNLEKAATSIMHRANALWR